MSVHFAYLSRGTLHVKNGDGEVRLVESRFGQSIRDRAVQIHDRNAWKTQGTGARFMGGGALWGGVPRDAAALRLSIAGIARGVKNDELVYALDTDEISGVFRLEEGGSAEQRLLHTADFRVGRLHSNGSDRIACTLARKGGNSCIAVMRPDGSEMIEVTQGDAVDDSPHWLPGSSEELVFQSAAIGRDQNGFAAAKGPFTIQKLNLEQGQVTTLLEDAQHDLLSPQMASDGSLYYIRRPYVNPRQGANFLRAAWDLVLLPFRLLFAIFQYLNFFTARYTGNTLTTAGGARQKNADVRQMMIWGNLIEAGRAEGGADRGSKGVPKNWELMRRGADGKEEALAKQVVSFDLCADGSLLFSNGAGVYHRMARGEVTLLAEDGLIEQVIALA